MLLLANRKAEDFPQFRGDPLPRRFEGNRIVKGVRRPTEAQILRIAIVLLGSQRQIMDTNLLLERGDCYTLGQPPAPAEGG